MDNKQIKKLQSSDDFPDLVEYLRDELDWPIEEHHFDDLTFEYSATELGIDEQNAAKIVEIKRLRPLDAHQPWACAMKVWLGNVCNTFSSPGRPGSSKQNLPSVCNRTGSPASAQAP